MKLIPGNRIYKCNGCGHEVHVNMMLSGVPHCNMGEYEFISEQPQAQEKAQEQS